MRIEDIRFDPAPDLDVRACCWINQAGDLSRAHRYNELAGDSLSNELELMAWILDHLHRFDDDHLRWITAWRPGEHEAFLLGSRIDVAELRKDGRSRQFHRELLVSGGWRRFPGRQPRDALGRFTRR